MHVCVCAYVCMKWEVAWQAQCVCVSCVYVFSVSQGHLFPTLVPTDALHEYQEEADLQQAVGQGVPPNCERLCRHTDNTQQVRDKA